MRLTHSYTVSGLDYLGEQIFHDSPEGCSISGSQADSPCGRCSIVIPSATGRENLPKMGSVAGGWTLELASLHFRANLHFPMRFIFYKTLMKKYACSYEKMFQTPCDRAPDEDGGEVGRALLWILTANVLLLSVLFYDGGRVWRAPSRSSRARVNFQVKLAARH